MRETKNETKPLTRTRMIVFRKVEEVNFQRRKKKSKGKTKKKKELDSILII